MPDVRLLWKAPDVNPVNQKARSIPALNPANVYGRVFTFAWFGFMVAFMSWYALFVLLAFCAFLMLAAGMRFHHWYDIVWVSVGKRFLQCHQVFTLILDIVEHYHCQ